MLPCPKCTYENELGRIFCHKCGTKLDLSQIKAPSQGGKSLRKKGSSKNAKTVRVVVELVVLILLSIAVLLAWQVPPLPTGEPTARQIDRMEQKRFDLEAMIDRNRAARLEVTADDLNAYLFSLKMEPPREQWLVFVPQRFYADLGENEMRIRMWGELRLFGSVKKNLYFSYLFRPSAGGGALQAKPLAGRVGQLPFAPVLLEYVPIIQRFIFSAFNGKQIEVEHLRKLSAIQVTPERVTLEYQPRAGER